MRWAFAVVVALLGAGAVTLVWTGMMEAGPRIALVIVLGVLTAGGAGLIAMPRWRPLLSLVLGTLLLAGVLMLPFVVPMPASRVLLHVGMLVTLLAANLGRSPRLRAWIVRRPGLALYVAGAYLGALGMVMIIRHDDRAADRASVDRGHTVSAAAVPAGR